MCFVTMGGISLVFAMFSNTTYQVITHHIRDGQRKDFRVRTRDQGKISVPKDVRWICGGMLDLDAPGSRGERLDFGRVHRGISQ